MMWFIAGFLLTMSSVTSTREKILLSLTASKPHVEFKTSTFLRPHLGNADYLWHVSAPGNVAQLTVSCNIDIIDSPKCFKASFWFYENDHKIPFCGRKHISKTLPGSTNIFRFKSSMCINFFRRGIFCTVSYNPENIPTATTPVNPSCTCGEKGPPRIIGGKETAPNEYPWQAMLKAKHSRFPFCGGSLIAKIWVLTANHCVNKKNAFSFLVVLGEHKYDDLSSVRVSLKVSKIILHQHYEKNVKFDNDVALLKLANPVAFNNFISPICLPFNYKYYDFTDKTGITTGWGRTIQYDTHSLSPVLKQIDQKIIMPSKCTWLDGYGWKQREITESMICTLAKNGKSHKGDSGGPMVWKSDSSDLYFQVGVSSFIKNNTDPNEPTVHARVSQFVEWIEAKTSAGKEFCVKI